MGRRKVALERAVRVYVCMLRKEEIRNGMKEGAEGRTDGGGGGRGERRTHKIFM